MNKLLTKNGGYRAFLNAKNILIITAVLLIGGISLSFNKADLGQEAINCPLLNTEICDDGIDNDGDGLIDCADPDCGVSAFCGCSPDNSGNTANISNELAWTSVSVGGTYDVFINTTQASVTGNSYNTFDVVATNINSGGNSLSEAFMSFYAFAYWDQTNNIADDFWLTWNSTIGKFETTADDGTLIYIYPLSATVDGSPALITSLYLHSDGTSVNEIHINNKLNATSNHSFTDQGTGVSYSYSSSLTTPDYLPSVNLGSFTPTDSKNLTVTWALEYADGRDAFLPFSGDGAPIGDLDWEGAVSSWDIAAAYDYSDADGYTLAGHAPDICNPALYIGDTRGDTELNKVIGGVVADQGNSVSDEADLGFPAIMTNSIGYSISVPYVNNTGADATLAAWIDLDNNGVFNASERQPVLVAAGSGTAIITWYGISVNASASGLIARLRLASTAAEVTSPGGFASNGEVEDHLILVVDACDPIASGNTDTDGDNISNVCDLDDDNDGILDTDECSVYIEHITSKDASRFTITTTDVTLSNIGQQPMLSVNAKHAIDGAADIYAPPGYSITFDDDLTLGFLMLPDGGTLDAYYNDPDDIPDQGAIYGDYIYNDSDWSIETTIDLTGVDLSSIPNFKIEGVAYADDEMELLVNGISLGVFTSSWYSDPDVISYSGLVSNLVAGVNTFTARVGNPSPGSTGVLFDLDFAIECDTDQDGIVNRLDLDSDNDGIFDLDEAGHTAADNNDDGMIDGSNTGSGTNGLFDGVETTAESGTINYTISDSETTPDGTYDPYELDSDGDGCFDAQEASVPDSENDGIAGTDTPIVDANGLVTSIFPYTSPTNNIWQNPLAGSCLAEICNNGFDDDGDGLSDCLDIDCCCVRAPEISK